MISFLLFDLLLKVLTKDGQIKKVKLPQSSVSKVLNEVVDCINVYLLQKYMKFPTSPVIRQRIKDWYVLKFEMIITNLCKVMINFSTGFAQSTIFLV